MFCRCVAKSTEVNNQEWYYILEGEPVNHDVELQCTKKNNLLTQCGKDSEFLCADMKQCVPNSWKCDNITDCSDGSDECPRLNETEIKSLNTLFKIDNDIQSTPKLTVIINVLIDSRLYIDKSNTMKNITVIAKDKKGLNIESHTCTFEEIFPHIHDHDYIHSSPLVDTIQCGYNSTKLQFTR